MPRRRPRERSSSSWLGSGRAGSGQDVGGDRLFAHVGRRGRRGHPETSTRMAWASAPPSTSSLAEARERGTREGLLVDDLEGVAGRDPALAEVAQHLGVGVRDAHEAAAVAGVQRAERHRRALVDLEVRGRDRVAVRVVGRMAELGGDELLELLGDDVLEHLGLVVDAVPRHVQVLGQVELEQPVVAQDLQRDALALGGQLDAAVGQVLDEAEPVELLDHARRRRGRDPEALGHRVGRHRAAAPLQRVDRLGVVLDRLAGALASSIVLTEMNYGTPKSRVCTMDDSWFVSCLETESCHAVYHDRHGRDHADARPGLPGA